MDIQFKVMTYNIFQPVNEPIRYYGQKERSARLEAALRPVVVDVDAIVIQEAVIGSARRHLDRAASALGFAHRTKDLNALLSVAGGVIIYSRHEIVQEASSVFGDNCIGADCFAAKGIVFARIRKEGRFFNLFGTHMQAWPSLKAQAVRDQQIKHIERFMASFQLPADEPCLLAGDLNIDMYEHKSTLKHLTYRLSLTVPTVSDESHMFTIDPKTNALVGADDISAYRTPDYPNGCKDVYVKTQRCPCCFYEWLDYTLFSRKHLQPTSSRMQAIMLKVPEPFSIKWMSLRGRADVQDLSDHYPVVGTFVFPPAPDGVSLRRSLTLDRVADKEVEVTATSHVVLLVVIVLSAVAIACLAVWGGWRLMAGRRRARARGSTKTGPKRKRNGSLSG